MKTYDLHLLLAFLPSAGECTEGTYQDDGYGYFVTASKLDVQRLQVLKEAFYHYLEGQQTNLNGRRRIFTELTRAIVV